MKSRNILLSVLTMHLFFSACATRRLQTSDFNKPTVTVTTNSSAPTTISLPTVVSHLTIETNLPSQRPTNTLSSIIDIPTNASPAYISNLIATTSIADLHKAYELGLIDKGLVIQAGLMAENKQSLDFYGKVVDQKSEPVVGAKVQGNVVLNISFVKSKDEIHFAETDSEGRFNFLGLHGIGLGIWPQKESYDYNLKLPSRRPADYRPDPNNPVVFTMWKLKGSEPMIHKEIESRIPYDGTPATFDLVNGKKNPSGNLRITLLRNPLKVARRGRDRFDWTGSVEIIGGGLLPENDAYPNWAPENGYQATFVKSVIATNIPWQRSLTQNFYFRDERGNYGRLFIDLATDSDTADTGIGIEAWINPSGSRNLEFDPAKQIR